MAPRHSPECRMASTKEEAFEAFERHGPDAFTAAQWVDADLPPDKLPDGESAPLISTNKDYLYQLRGDFKAQHQTSEADEGASTSEEAEEATETTEDTDPEPDSGQSEATEPEPEPEPTPTEPEAAPPDPAPPTKTGGGEAVEVGHEGKEKLSPDGFEDESVASIEPPDGLDLPEGTKPRTTKPNSKLNWSGRPTTTRQLRLNPRARWSTARSKWMKPRMNSLELSTTRSTMSRWQAKRARPSSNCIRTAPTSGAGGSSMTMGTSLPTVARDTAGRQAHVRDWRV